jgi:4a-hydroxytetrahydrobiopterin dehydratase
MDTSLRAEADESKSNGRCPACGCVGPNPGYEALSKGEVEVEFKVLRENFWILSEDYLQIKRKFRCRNWKAAIDFINAASEIAESEAIQHHPDINLTKYRDVEVILWTHAAGGLTLYDFKLAKALETIEIDYSPKWLKSQSF